MRRQEREREEQKICCCGVFTWAKAVAYLQFLYGFTLAVIAIPELDTAVILFSEEDETQNKAADAPDKNVLLIFCSIALILSLFVLFMGILLLVSIRKNNTCGLMSWIVVSILFMLLGTVTTIYWWADGGHYKIIDLIVVAVRILIYSFGSRIVYICRREMLRGVISYGWV